MTGKGFPFSLSGTVAGKKIRQVFVCSRPVEQSPGIQSRQGPSRWHQKKRGSLVHHQSVELRKTQIIAGGNPGFTPGQIHHHRLFTRGQQFPLVRLVSKKVNFSILAHNPAIRSQKKGRVKQVVTFSQHQTTHQKMDSQVRGLFPESGHHGAVNGLTVAHVPMK